MSIQGGYPAYHQETDFGLILFYGISTLVGHLMPDPFLYICDGKLK